MHMIVTEGGGDLGALNLTIGKKEHAVLRDSNGRIIARIKINDKCPLKGVPVIIEAPRSTSISRVQN